jgi:hypothetical protein
MKKIRVRNHSHSKMALLMEPYADSYTVEPMSYVEVSADFEEIEGYIDVGVASTGSGFTFLVWSVDEAVVRDRDGNVISPTSG